MPATLVVARGPSVFLLASDGSPPRELRAPTVPGAGVGPARPGGDPRPENLPSTLREGISSEGLSAPGRRFREAVSEALGRPVAPASPAAWRRGYCQLPRWPPEERRSYLLALARARLDRVLRSPEEIVVSLAREEERFERAVTREERAAETFVSPPSTVLESHARDWSTLRGQLHEHHRRLVRRLEGAAVELLPNLSAVVGPRVAARLLAAAGGLGTLSRISSSRLQLLGARRRPSPERGPRYGLLYRADSLDEVPADRRAAFARSLASLAVIAARADATTHAAIAPGLLARRARRAAELRRGRR